MIVVKTSSVVMNSVVVKTKKIRMKKVQVTKVRENKAKMKAMAVKQTMMITAYMDKYKHYWIVCLF